MSEKYTYKDMEESMVPLENPEHHKRFLATFQRQRGYPKPSAKSKTVVHNTVKIYRKGNLLEEKSWKLPQGAVSILWEDQVFMIGLLVAWTKKLGGTYWVTRASKCFCDACGGQAVHERRSLKCLKIPMPDVESFVVFNVDLYYLCGETSCKMFAAEILRLEQKKIIKSKPDFARFLRFECAACQKWEARSEPTFFVCSKCKVTFYCSRECQLQDWKEGGHKQECKENYRTKIKKEKAKAKAAEEEKEIP